MYRFIVASTPVLARYASLISTALLALMLKMAGENVFAAKQRGRSTMARARINSAPAAAGVITCIISTVHEGIVRLPACSGGFKRRNHRYHGRRRPRNNFFNAAGDRRNGVHRQHSIKMRSKNSSRKCYNDEIMLESEVTSMNSNGQ